jgi:hypothetical protein
MRHALIQIVVWLNAVSNTLGGVLLAPLGLLPGWLSATLVAVGSGLLLLLGFKYTSNQSAIRAVRGDIKAHLLALKLFRESPRVMLRAQGRILWGAVRSASLAVVPLLLLAPPVCLLLGQVALWYQARPLRVGEEAVLVVKLNGGQSTWPVVRLRPTDALQVTAGPVRVLSKRELCWNLKARRPGYHRLVLKVDGQAVEKEVAIGEGFMRVSTLRPGWQWREVLLHPAEPPFTADSTVHSIAIEYPNRSSWTSGTDAWLVYWVVVSMVAALCFSPWLKVKI